MILFVMQVQSKLSAKFFPTVAFVGSFTLALIDWEILSDLNASDYSASFIRIS